MARIVAALRKGNANRYYPAAEEPLVTAVRRQPQDAWRRRTRMNALKCFPVAIATVLLMAACGSQAQPAAPSTPAAPAASAPAQSAPAQAKPAASGVTQPAASSPAQSKSSWDDTVAAANKEGSVVVITVGAEAIRTDLTEGFKKRYPQINVDFSLMPPSGPTPKLMTEFSAKKVTTDVTMVGVNGYLSLMDAGALADVHPYLAGPDTGESKQLNGKWHFADKASQYMLVFSAYVKLAWAYTANTVDGSQFKGWKDMLDPKWKGKIIMGDPTTP